MLRFAHRRGGAPLRWRIFSAGLSFLLLFYFVVPDIQLFAQDYRVRQQDFQSFEKSLQNLDRYVDRAERMEGEQDWNNYVELGVATEFVAWEREALDLLQTGIERIEQAGLSESERDAAREEARAAYAAARQVWEDEALLLQEERRGEYRARLAAVDVADVDVAIYAGMVAAAEAAAFTGSDVDLDAFDLSLTASRANLETDFEAELAREIDRARSEHAGLGAVEQQAFEDELSAIQDELRREFEVQDNFYIVRSRNRLISLQRGDDFNAKLLADSESAENIAEDLLAQTESQIATDTRDMLNAAVAEANATLDGANNPDLSSVENDWERQIEAIINSGLEQWQRAEEDLYASQLAWTRETKTRRETGMAIWKANYEQLGESRSTWLDEVQSQIEAGRLAWDAKFAEFTANRASAEAELAEYVRIQRERWAASSQELVEIVGGSSSALLEAQEGLRYYETLLNSNQQHVTGETRAFYIEERDRLRGMLTSFGNIMAESEGVLEDRMHSDAGDTGLLFDRRSFARNLPTLVAGLDAGDYRDELADLMNAQGEDFVLYRRDMDALIDSNEIFSARARDLAASSEFDPAAATDLAALRDQVGTLERKYDDHRLELLAIIDQDRGAISDADRLTAVKAEIAAWVTEGGNENARLRAKTIEYFQGGAAGYYLSDAENDPYLMTEAELQWELLRRERNFLAKRLNAAQAVKTYADKAFQGEAGLEMAAVTAERAEMAGAASRIKEIAFRLIRGDFTLDPAAATDPVVRAAERDRLLDEREVDWAYLEQREAGLLSELGLLDTLIAETALADPDFVGTTASIDNYLDTQVDAERRDGHPLQIIREKLQTYRTARDSGDMTDPEKRNRLDTLAVGFQSIRDMLAEVQADFDIAGMRADRAALLTIMAGPNLKQHQAGLDTVRADIEANALALRAASAELEQAQEEYRRARVDFEALRSGSAAELLNAEVRDATDGLALVLNRMAKIEDIPDFNGPVRDEREAAELRYLHDVSENQRFNDREASARELLEKVEGLELARGRRLVLDEIITANVPVPADPAVFAAALIDRENDLLLRDSSTDRFESHYLPVASMDLLKSLRQQHDDLVAAGAPAPGPALQEYRAQVTILKDEIGMALESLFAGIRAEEETRRQEAEVALQSGNAVDVTALATRSRDEEQALNAYARDLAADAAEALETFLTDNRAQSYEALLTNLNDQIDAAAAALSVRTSDDPLAATARPTAAERDYKILGLVRDYILDQRGLIETSNLAPADTNPDPRTVDTKWDILLAGIAEQKNSAAFQANFAASRPTDAGDARVTAFQSERESLRDAVDALLSESDANLFSAYRALDANARTLIDLYVPGEQPGSLTDPVRLRASLETAHRGVVTQLAALPVNFRAIIDKEDARLASIELHALAPVLDELEQQVRDLEFEIAADENEKARLIAERDAETDPVIQTELAGRIAALDDRLTAAGVALDAITPQYTTDRARLLELQNLLIEINQPGTSAFLGDNARATLRPLNESRTALAGLVRSLEELDGANESTAGDAMREQIGAILGIFATNEYDEIKRDATGAPLVSQEFQNLAIPGVSNRGGADLRNNLDQVLAGAMRGDHLALWAERLAEWTYSNRSAAEPELLAAIDLLQESLREYRFAEEILRTRNQTTDQVVADATALETRAAALTEKLNLFAALEGRLSQALSDAEREERDSLQPALDVLTTADVPALLQLFDGFDMNGAVDNVSDPDLARRADELEQLRDSLLDMRQQRLMLAVQEEFAAERSSLFGTNAVGRSIAEVLDAHPELDADSRAALIPLLEEIDQGARRDRDLVVETDLAGLIGAYATRATTARTQLTPEIDAVNPADDIVLARAQFLGRVDVLLAGSAFASLRRELHAVAGDATTSAELKTSIGDALTALTDPSTDELDRLGAQIAERELRMAIVRSDSSPVYTAAAYPTELQDFILVRAYTRARERSATFQRLRASDREDERASAALDLSGISGDVASHFLIADFDDFIVANTPAAFRAATAGASLNGYLGSYLNDRGTDLSRLPADGASALYSREAHREYLRLQNDITAAGDVAGLDPADYFSEFGAYLQVAKFEHFAAATGYTHPGATRAERETALRAAFADFLNDAAYTVGGKTLGDTLPTDAEREELLSGLLVHLEYAGDLEDHLPGLGDRIFAGTLNDPLSTAEQFLPAELRAIAGYETADYRALATAAGPDYRAALARAEVLEQSAAADLSVFVADSELEQIVVASGQGDLDAAARAELVALLRDVNLRQRAGGTDQTEALRRLRREQAEAAIFTDAASRETLSLLLAGNRAEADSIEDKFFAGLDARNGELRVLAKARRGDLLVTLARRGAGQADALYDAQSPLIRGEIDALVGHFATALTANERSLLENQSVALRDLFDYRSAQELIDSGIVESVEAAVLNIAYTGLAQAERESVRARPDLASRAFLETFYQAEGRGTLSPASATFIAGIPGFGALLNTAVADLDPGLQTTLRGEQVLLERFFDRFQERGEDRVELSRVLADPAAANPLLNLSFFNGIQTTSALLENQTVEMTAAIKGLLGDHARQLARANDANLSASEMARRMLDFADVRGRPGSYLDGNGQTVNVSRFEDSRFMNFRTYAGLEEQAYDGGTAPVLADQRVGGGASAESILGGDYLAVLKSDPTSTGEDAAFNTVSDNRDADMSDTMSRRLYYENLANNFLSATTNLNRALSRVISAGDLAEKRLNTSASELAADVLNGYDPGESAAQDLDPVRTIVQQAAADSAVYSASRSAESRGAAVSRRGQFEEASTTFALSGRRTLLMNQQMDTYLDRVFGAAQNRMENAQNAFEALQLVETNNRNTFTNLNTAHIEAMNRMAEWVRDFKIANDEFEIRRSVREFAETPYLFATAEDSYGAVEDGDELQSDALAEYELARAALSDVQDRMQQAAEAMAIQDNLAEFAAIVDIIENGTAAARNALGQALDADERLALGELRDRKFGRFETLSAADETLLLNLSRRALYERHAPLITARAEYIGHEMQAVRVQKAAEIIAAEVERRQAKSDMARQRFEQLQAQMFGSFNAGAGVSQADWEKARDAVHLRLAQMVADNPDANNRKNAFYDEYRAWFEIAHAESIEHGGNEIVDKYVTDDDYSVTQRREKTTAEGLAATQAMNNGVRQSLKVWMQAGGFASEVGTGFSGFTQQYKSFLAAAGVYDDQAEIKRITDNNWLPVMLAGIELVAIGLAAGFFQFWLLLLIPIGTGMIVGAERHMSNATKERDAAQRYMADLQASAKNASLPPSLTGLQTAMETYARAQSEVEYFTKSPDLQTLKKRIYEWGINHEDETPGSTEKLYRLQDDDLRYLVDQFDNGTTRYIDRDGAAEPLTDREKNDALDITGQRNDVKYKDAYGNEYDPTTLGGPTNGTPTPKNGIYTDNAGVTYVRVQTTDHRGVSSWQFARRVDGNTYKAYDMKTVLDAMAGRSREIANDYRDEYYARGDALTDEAGGAARTFVLAERDATLESLFDRSAARAEGGREFGGYGEVYQAYSANGENVFNSQLSQGAFLQRREWDMRQADLVKARESWEKKINTILKRGRLSWANSEDRFLAEWRRWEREMDAEDAAGQKVWDERIEEHFTARDEWSEEVRAKSAELTIETVVGDAADQLNAQLIAASTNLGADIAALDKTAIINQAIDDMRRSLPSATDRKNTINAGIQEFNTMLSASQLTGGNFSTDSVLNGKFKQQMEEYSRSMKVLANVQMFEQFQNLQDTLINQINRQNQAIEDRTTSAALASGYTLDGETFSRTSHLSGGSATVKAYQWFNAEAALDNEIYVKRNVTKLDGQDLIDRLRDYSETEVASFFDVQRLRIKEAMQVVMGSESPTVGQRDPEMIGLFWAWAGTSRSTVQRFEKLDDVFGEQQSSMEAAMVESNFDLVTFRTLLDQLQTDGLEEEEREAIVRTLEMLQGEIQERGAGGSVALSEEDFRKLLESDSEGFGELGGVISRHGSGNLNDLFPWAVGSGDDVAGFFPQLNAGLSSIAQDDQEWRENAAAMDPFTAIVNSFNPIVMIASAKNNYEIQVNVYDQDPGEMLAAAFATVGKGLLAAVGTALLAATGFGAGAAVALASFAAATTMVAVSNMIRIGPDGKASFSAGMDTLINTVLTVGTAAVGGAGAAASSRLTAGGMKYLAGAAAGTGVLGASTLIGVQGNIKYDETGNVTGFEEDAGRVFADIGTAMAGLGMGKAIGGKFKNDSLGAYLGEELGQHSATTFTEFVRFKTGQENFYGSLSDPGLDRLGALVGGRAGARAGGRLTGGPYADAPREFQQAIQRNGDMRQVHRQLMPDIRNAAADARWRRQHAEVLPDVMRAAAEARHRRQYQAVLPELMRAANEMQQSRQRNQLLGDIIRAAALRNRRRTQEQLLAEIRNVRRTPVNDLPLDGTTAGTGQGFFASMWNKAGELYRKLYGKMNELAERNLSPEWLETYRTIAERMSPEALADLFHRAKQDINALKDFVGRFIEGDGAEDGGPNRTDDNALNTGRTDGTGADTPGATPGDRAIWQTKFDRVLEEMGLGRRNQNNDDAPAPTEGNGDNGNPNNGNGTGNDGAPPRADGTGDPQAVQQQNPRPRRFRDFVENARGFIENMRNDRNDTSQQVRGGTMKNLLKTAKKGDLVNTNGGEEEDENDLLFNGEDIVQDLRRDPDGFGVTPDLSDDSPRRLR